MGTVGYDRGLTTFKGAKKPEMVAIFGFDTEYVSRPGQHSELICWQLSYEGQAVLLTSKLTIKSLYEEARKLMSKADQHLVLVDRLIFVTYFARAEIQFFDLMDWRVGETGDTYTLDQMYEGITLTIADLAPWYNLRPLRMVAEIWGYKKLDFPIGDKVEAISRGEATIEELLADEEFRTYALNDAIITEKLYIAMREYFWQYWNIEVLDARTIAQAAAWAFKRKIEKPILHPAFKIRQLTLKCCWGGRMELIQPGNFQDVYEYDAVGHHPNSAIALGEMPEGDSWIETLNLEEWVSGISGFGMVGFRFPKEELFPCLPVFHNDSLLYPLSGVSYCTVSEVRLALELGAKITLYNAWYYKKGTRILTEHLLDIQQKRNTSDNFAYKELLKLLSNSLIGKFFQKVKKSDLPEIQQLAIKEGIPFGVASLIWNTEHNKKITSVGTCYYPEWYGLILGHARYSISRLARNHSALVISSDSLVTQEKLAEEFVSDAITFKLKLAGEYVGYRSRLYRVGNKYAHHAIHDRDIAKTVLATFTPNRTFGYNLERILNLRESWRRKLPFGSILQQKMTVDLHYDFKRRLRPDGTTEPWDTVHEREEFLRLRKTKQLRLF